MSDQYPAEAEALIAPWFMERTKSEILQACLEQRIPCVPVQTFDEALADPQLNARDYFREVEHPWTETYRYPGPPYRLSGAPRPDCYARRLPWASTTGKSWAMSWGWLRWQFPIWNGPG